MSHNISRETWVEREAALLLRITEQAMRIGELESQLDAHERWNARCPECGRTHFTLLEDKRCRACVYGLKSSEAQDRIAELEDREERLRKTLMYFWDHGYLIDIHDPGCPEDDTCHCPRARRLQAALEGKT